MSDLSKYITVNPTKLEEFKSVIEAIKSTPAPEVEVIVFDSIPNPKSNWEEKEYRLCQ